VDVVALIPARGGSKGLARKNLAPFLGRPLLTWAIGAGHAAELVTRVIVSTDDEEIAAVARADGAEVPFMRPPELAEDLTPDLPVFEHALGWLAEHDAYVPDLVVHLRPTSPIRPPGLVDDGIRALLADPTADSLRVVCEAPANPFKMWRIVDGVLVPLVDSGIPEAYNLPRQELPTAYWQIGMLDVIRPATILEQHSMSGRRIVPLVVDTALAADVDDAASLARAEHLARGSGFTAEPDEA
jgi:N-acylneuraminate cytidylyltransferase